MNDGHLASALAALAVIDLRASSLAQAQEIAREIREAILAEMTDEDLASIAASGRRGALAAPEDTD
jgi:hypothetical protein